jgi:hypothetical protein
MISGKSGDLPMTVIELHEEAFDELQSKFTEAALIEAGEWRAPFTVGDITYKLYEYVPTAEDIARRKEFEATPLGQIMKASLAKYQAEYILERNAFIDFVEGEQWPKGLKTELRIRMPKDYTVT